MALPIRYDSLQTRDAITLYTERANLFKLALQPSPRVLYLRRRTIGRKLREEYRFISDEESETVDANPRQVQWAVQGQILEAIGFSGHRVRRKRHRWIVTDTRSNFASHPGLRMYPSFELRVIEFNDNFYLCLDHTLNVQANLSVRSLLQKNRGFQPIPLQRIMYRTREGWQEARLIELGPNHCEVNLASDEAAVVPSTDVFLELTRSQIIDLAPILGLKPDELERSIKQLSLLTVERPSLARLEACSNFAQQLATDTFPISAGAVVISLDPSPAVLVPPAFEFKSDLDEPTISFDRVDSTKRSSDVMDGLTQFGAYDDTVAPIRLVLLSTEDRLPAMERLVNRLNNGSVKYRGAEKTFGGEFVVSDRIVAKRVSDYVGAVRELAQDPRIEDFNVALVYLPKGSDARNPNHPYYQTKSVLLREGLASQMVDEATVRNPDWRDFNLALNVYAKAGYVPWVLDEAMPSVDLLIGLSTSTVGRGLTQERIMAYINVFDSYGRWRFYRGDAKAFPFSQRLDHFEQLVRDAVAAFRAQSSGSTPLHSIYFHITKPLSREERAVLTAAVRVAAPGASVSFVWVNPHHALRFFDVSTEAKGEIGRASYLLQQPTSVFLTTTGRNMFGQRGMGTPVPLQLTVWTEPYAAKPPLEHVAQQVFSLTRLNWASSRNFCHEPITTKFAGDIAKQMAVFALDPRFSIHSRLRQVPWFL